MEDTARREWQQQELDGEGQMYSGMTVLDMPSPKEKAQRKLERYVSAIVVVLDPLTKPLIGGSSKVLMTKRSEHSGLLAGMWEFPSVNVNEESQKEANSVTSVLHRLKKDYDIDIQKQEHGPKADISASTAFDNPFQFNLVKTHQLEEIRHVFSHMTWHVKPHLVLVETASQVNKTVLSDLENDNMKWIDYSKFKPSLYTSLVRKIWKLVKK